MKERKKAIWLVAGGPMQRVAAEKILARGFRLIISDGDKDCVLVHLADEFVEVDIFDVENHIKHADKLNELYEISGVFTAASDCHETVALLAQHLELHGIDPAVSKTCRQKHQTRKVLSDYGIIQPRSALATTFKQAIDIANELTYPIAVKPTDSSGSRGFFAIKNRGEFTELKFKKALSFGSVNAVIIEDLLTPIEDQIAELSVETLWVDGNYFWLNWVDRLFRSDFKYFPNLFGEGENPYENVNWGVELAHLNPAQHSVSIEGELRSLLERAGKAIGMTEQKGGHILKFDIMLTDKGPVILEMTPRLSGGWDSSLSSVIRGGDLVDGAIGMSLGEQIDKSYIDKYFSFKNKPCHVAVLSKIELNAENCIGRRFVCGKANNRINALTNAIDSLKMQKFI